MRCAKAVLGTGVSATEMKGAGLDGFAAERRADAEEITGVKPYSISEFEDILKSSLEIVEKWSCMCRGSMRFSLLDECFHPTGVMPHPYMFLIFF